MPGARLPLEQLGGGRGPAIDDVATWNGNNWVPRAAPGSNPAVGEHLVLGKLYDPADLTGTELTIGSWDTFTGPDFPTPTSVAYSSPSAYIDFVDAGVYATTITLDVEGLSAASSTFRIAMGVLSQTADNGLLGIHLTGGGPNVQGGSASRAVREEAGGMVRFYLAYTALPVEITNVYVEATIVRVA